MFQIGMVRCPVRDRKKTRPMRILRMGLEVKVEVLGGGTARNYAFALRRAIKPAPASPRPINSMEAGSGTGEAEKEAE